jgi:regulator of nucleoside diphosphate kinase
MHMIAQRTLNRTELTVTEADFDRLKHLVESPRYRVSHAVLIPALREGLERSRVVEPARVPKEVVTMNSKVRVRDLKADEAETYTLVYPDNADINDGKLSVLAPLGTALLGARVGQVVEFLAPGGTRRLNVEKILYQPEASGDLHL